MPKLIDYPRTSYTGAWEVAEVVDDTGGKCALETCARKLNRKVSGSFKAIVGSAVKFGLLTSKRELLATTTLFRRIKHAYDKQEELVFHREAFLTPPLFTQLCRKFRARELPVAMLDVLLMREFSVEEINAQSVAKAFIDGARMVNLLDEHDLIADIDQLAAQQPPRRELASLPPPSNVFRQVPPPTAELADDEQEAPDEATDSDEATETASSGAAAAVATTEPSASTVAPAKALAAPAPNNPAARVPLPPSRPAPTGTTDAIASLFGLSGPPEATPQRASNSNPTPIAAAPATSASPPAAAAYVPLPAPVTGRPSLFRIQLAGPGLNTELEVSDVEDLALVRALLDKIERQLRK